MAQLNALYYPFSRCLDANQLKHFLLVFEQICFLDPVDDDDWRAKLLSDVSHEHPGFSSYQSVFENISTLKQEGVIKIIDPCDIASMKSDLTVASSVSDLNDPNWVGNADPLRFNLPTQFDGESGKPCWHIFKPKLPDSFVNALTCDEKLSRHMIRMSDEHHAWTLSYAAGSSIAINSHLAAADELSLAPVTDSRLHNELLLRKLTRTPAGQDMSITDTGVYASQLSQGVLVELLSELLPQSKLETLDFDEIIKFRKKTKDIRLEFTRDIKRKVLALDIAEKSGSYDALVARVVNDILRETKQYSEELAATRDRLWPELVGSLNTNLFGTSSAGIVGSYIIGSGYLLAASATFASIEPLKSVLDWRAEIKKTKRSASSSIAYLTKLEQI